MNISNRAVLTLACTLFLAGTLRAEEAFPTASPESQGLSPEALAQLAERVSDYVQRDLAVGAELLVIKNRRTVLHETFGSSDREQEIAWSDGTICNIRSMTKTLTGAAAQLLIDRGQLRLDDTVATHLPSFDYELARGITIEQLLTHRSGLPLTILESAIDEYESLAAQADAVGDRGPEFEPGSKFWYSDAASDVLGAVVAAISGRSLDEFVKEELLDPLGMRDSFYALDAEDDRFDRIASLYIGGPGNWTRFWKHEDGPLYPFAWGSQTLYGTPTDYAKFLAMWMDDGRVGDRQLLSREAIERTLTPASPMSMLGSDGRMPTFFPDLEVFYGQMSVLHVPVDAGPDGSDGSDRRAAIIGHSGSDGTIAWAWPERDLMVLYFTQSRGGTTALRLEEEIDRLLLHPERYAEAEPVPEELAPYLGIYVANFATFVDEEFEVLFRNGKLALDIPSQMTFELAETEEEGRWRFAITNEITISFGRDDAGEVNLLELTQSGMTFEVPRKGSALAAAQAVPDTVDPDLVEPLIGSYHDAENDRNLDVFLKEGVLSLTPQPGVVVQLRQMPGEEGRWQIRQMPIVTITFQKDESGATASMTVHTPDETVVMPRVDPASEDDETEQS